MASYTEKKRIEYPYAAAQMSAIIAATLRQLGGKESKNTNLSAGILGANFNKKIGKTPFNNRVQVDIRIQPQTDHSCVVLMKAYPVDPVGNKLAFGVQGEPAKMVADTLIQSWEASLSSP